MTKKSALEQFHKESISAAAGRLFLQYGIEKTTMDDIAREAEYSKATLYAYFKNKDDIFHYVVLKAMELLHEKIKKVLTDHNDAIASYYAMCDILVEYSDRYPLYFESMLETIAADAVSRKNSATLEQVYQVGELLNQDVAVLIQQGIREEVFRHDLPDIPTGLVHWSALSGMISLAAKKQDYISGQLNMSRQDFLCFGFQMMLRSVIRPGLEIPDMRAGS